MIEQWAINREDEASAELKDRVRVLIVSFIIDRSLS